MEIYKMRIAIDISQIVYGTGVSLYTKKLVENLLMIDRSDEYILWAGVLRRKQDVLRTFPQAKVFPLPPVLADFVWNRLHILPIEKFIGRVDVFHSSDWAEPPSRAFKVTTVHDLIPLKFPKLIHRRILESHIRRLEWVKRESDRVIVPSKSTMADLINYGVSDEKIRVIPEAGILSRADDGSVSKVKTKYKILGDYLVAFASGPYKNIERIKKAFELSAAGKNLKLIIVGRQSVALVKEDRNVRLTGFVKEDERAALLTGSRGLVFASIYEGFGQPILDAFACGVPVVTSNTGSMGEVAGDAASLVDPNSVASISSGIEKILRGPKAYVERGSKRASEFSWQKTADETLEVYNEAKNTDM